MVRCPAKAILYIFKVIMKPDYLFIQVLIIGIGTFNRPILFYSKSMLFYYLELLSCIPEKIMTQKQTGHAVSFNLFVRRIKIRREFFFSYSLYTDHILYPVTQ